MGTCRCGRSTWYKNLECERCEDLFDEFDR